MMYRVAEAKVGTPAWGPQGGVDKVVGMQSEQGA